MSGTSQYNFNRATHYNSINESINWPNFMVESKNLFSYLRVWDLKESIENVQQQGEVKSRSNRGSGFTGCHGPSPAPSKRNRFVTLLINEGLRIRNIIPVVQNPGCLNITRPRPHSRGNNHWNSRSRLSKNRGHIRSQDRQLFGYELVGNTIEHRINRRHIWGVILTKIYLGRLLAVSWVSKVCWKTQGV